MFCFAPAPYCISIWESVKSICSFSPSTLRLSSGVSEVICSFRAAGVSSAGASSACPLCFLNISRVISAIAILSFLLFSQALYRSPSMIRRITS